MNSLSKKDGVFTGQSPTNAGTNIKEARIKHIYTDKIDEYTAGAGVTLPANTKLGDLAIGDIISSDNPLLKTSMPTFAGLTVDGDLNLNGTLNMGGSGAAFDDLTVNNNLDVGGNTTIGGTLNVAGLVNGRNIAVDGAALDSLISGSQVYTSLSVTNNLDVGGNTTIGGNIIVDGTVDGRDVALDGAALDTVVGRVNQDLKTSASPTFAGMNLTAVPASSTYGNEFLGLSGNNVQRIKSLAPVVGVSANDPSAVGAVFTPPTPSRSDVLYKTADSKFWYYNGTTYLPLSASVAQEWHAAGSNSDSTGDKTALIWREGGIAVGDGAIDVTDGHISVRGDLVAEPKILSVTTPSNTQSGFEITNNHDSTGFAASIKALGNGENRPSLKLVGHTDSDTGLVPVVDIVASINDPPALANRPIFGVRNGESSAASFQIEADGTITTSGAINGRDLVVDGTLLDTLAGRVNQDLKTTATPSFAALSLTSITSAPATDKFIVRDGSTLKEAQLYTLVRTDGDPNNSGTNFSPSTLTAKTGVLYFNAIDQSLWEYNGTNYTKVAAVESNWYLGGSDSDAGDNKSDRIWRRGSIIVGDGMSSSTAINGYIGATGDFQANPYVMNFLNTQATNAGSGFTFMNGSTLSFMPIIATTSTGSNPLLLLSVVDADTGTNPGIVLRTQVGAGGAKLATRPLLSVVNGNSSPTIAMLLTAGGNLGIGTTTPTARLESRVASILTSLPVTASEVATSTPVSRDSAGTGSSVRALSSYIATNGAALQSHDVATGNGEQLILNPAGGNVGINTTNATDALTVVGNTKINGNIAVTGSVDGRFVAVDGDTLDTLAGRVGQDLNTTATPSFAGLTVIGNVAVSGTIDGRDVGADGTALDTVVSRVNQPLLTTSSPSFSGLTLSGATVNKVMVAGTGGVLSSIANLHWDSVNNRLGVVNTAPTSTLHVTGSFATSTSASIGSTLSVSSTSSFSQRATINSTTRTTACATLTNSGSTTANNENVTLETYASSLVANSFVSNRIGRSSANSANIRYLYGSTTALDQSNRLEFGHAGSLRMMSIDGTGRVHIGTTDMTGPGQLAINGGQGAAYVQVSGTATNGSVWKLGTPYPNYAAFGVSPTQLIGFGSYATDNSSFNEWVAITASGMSVSGYVVADTDASVGGNLTVSGLVNGRDIAADGATLDTLAGGSASYTSMSVTNNLNVGGQFSIAGNKLVIDQDGATTSRITLPEGQTLEINTVGDGSIVMNGGNITANELNVTKINNRTVADDTTALDTIVGRIDQDLKTTSTPTFAGINVASMTLSGPITANGANITGNITVSGTVDGRDVGTDGATLDTLAGRVGQDLNTTSTPTFASLTATTVNVGGNIVVDGTVDGRDVALDGTALDTVVGRVNQDLKTTASPAFAGMTVNGNIAVTGTVDGRDVSTDGGNLDTVVGRVNQDLKTTASPSFSTVTAGDINAGSSFKLGADIMNVTHNGLSSAFLTIPDSGSVTIRNVSGNGVTFNGSAVTAGSLSVSGNITVNGTVDGRDIGTDGTALDTVVGRVNQDLKTTASPSFNGLSVTSMTANKVIASQTGGSVLSINNLHWDSVNNRLGIVNTAPTATLHVTGTCTISSNTSVGGTFGSTGAATLSSTLSVTQRSSLASTSIATAAVTSTNSGTTTANGEALVSESYASSLALGSYMSTRVGRTNTNYFHMRFFYNNATATDQSNRLEFGTPGTARMMSLDATGRLHIGTSDVTNPGVVGVRGGSGTAVVQMSGTNGTNGTWKLATPSTGKAAFGVLPTETIGFGGIASDNSAYTEWANLTSTALTVNGNITTTGTVNGRNMSTDGGNLDTVVGRVNQDLKTTASPQFSSMTLTSGDTTANRVFAFLTNGVADPGFRLAAARGVTTQNPGDVQAQIGLDYGSISSAVRFHRGDAGNNAFMSFTTFGTERMRIDNAGRVGIGQSNPSFTLDVTGTGRFTGDVTVGGNLTTTGTVNGRNMATDASDLATVVGRVNQDLKTTASPTFQNVNVTSSVGSSSLSGNNLYANNIYNKQTDLPVSFAVPPLFKALFQSYLIDSVGSNIGILGPVMGNGSASGIGSSDFMWFFGTNGITQRRYYQIGSTAFFTGQHAGFCPGITMANIKEHTGMIVCSTGEMKDVDHTGQVVTGKDAISICQSLPELELSSSPMQTSVFGVVSHINNWNNAEIDDTDPEWDNGLHGMIRVNAIGEGAIWVVSAVVDDVVSTPIAMGNLICTSEVPGYGMKQNNSIFAAYTVGKSLMPCKFELNSDKYICEEFEFNGLKYRKAFIGCTYHCG